MLTSMRFAKHVHEGHVEELIALIVADMEDPVAPILETVLVGEGLHQAGCMITRLSEIVHDGTVMVEENLLWI
jgi:hypothetical protein